MKLGVRHLIYHLKYYITSFKRDIKIMLYPFHRARFILHNFVKLATKTLRKTSEHMKRRSH
jgi:hypothetical protein